MQRRHRYLRIAIYALATVQFVWCYLWLTRPYVNTLLYSQGKERMPFQGRCLMVPVMRWAHGSAALQWLSRPFSLSHFWFPRTVQPEVLVQAGVDVLCLAATGWFTVKIYEASSRRHLLTPFVYPLLLAVCGASYVMHTVQNFRFIYDLPSLALFTAALYVMYFRLHWAWFAAVFLVGTVNRETTLLLLPLYAIDQAIVDELAGGQSQSHFDWRRALRARTVLIVASLAALWVAMQIGIRHLFRENRSEFYPRFDWNLKSMVLPLAWPQLLSACGYLLLAAVLLRSRIVDGRLRAWLWIVPVWLCFMFSFGILIETWVFGELAGFVACASALIAEETIALRMKEAGSREGRVQHARPPAPVAVMGRRVARARAPEREAV